MFTTQSLYTQIAKLIAQQSQTTATTTTNTILTQTSSPDLLATSTQSATVSDLISAVATVLGSIVEARIITGLQVTQTNPVSNSVNISAGTGTANGQLFTLTDDIVLPINLNGYSTVYFLNMYDAGIVIEFRQNSSALTIAKIVVQDPTRALVVYDVKDDNGYDIGNAYIQSYSQYFLYGINDRFEEETIELLRANLGAIQASNIVGNMTLSENLKITNTTGTLTLNSSSLVFSDFNKNPLVSLTPTGLSFTRSDGVQLANFTTTGAMIGNIVISPNSLSSGNYVTGTTGFLIRDDGFAEFSNVTVRGNIYASSGTIGGWTIGSTSLYGTTTGSIMTGASVGSGQNGVILDINGLRVYNATLGVVVNLPSSGAAPTFSSGIINSTVFNIQTSSVIQTSSTVGNGTSNSYGILINNTGFYACAANQLLANANVSILTNGSAYFSGTISASAGVIGGTTITSTSLTGGLIIGSEIQSAIIETSATYPRVRIDTNGISYQVTTSSGKYDTFVYNSGTKYGTGVLAYLFNTNYPVLAITAAGTYADIRFYSRSSAPTGPNVAGDVAYISGVLSICTAPGSPGTWTGLALASSGTSNYIPYFNTSTTFANSTIAMNGSNVGVNTTSASHLFEVNSLMAIGNVYTTMVAPTYGGILIGENGAGGNCEIQFLSSTTSSGYGARIYGYASDGSLRIDTRLNAATWTNAVILLGTALTLAGSLTTTGITCTGGTITCGTLTATTAITGPITSGSSLLRGNGSGGFTNVTLGNGINFTSSTISSNFITGIQLFTSSGTWTCPTGVKAVYIKIQGGGGGGGTFYNGFYNGVSEWTYGGGGGGSGGYAEGIIAVTGNCTVTVGAGGGANTSGGTSYFYGTTTISASGGGAGNGSNPYGGGGGSASGGYFNISGYGGGTGGYSLGGGKSPPQWGTAGGGGSNPYLYGFPSSSSYGYGGMGAYQTSSGITYGPYSGIAGYVLVMW